MVVRNPGPRSRISVSGTLPPPSHNTNNALDIYCNGSRLGTVTNYSDKPLDFNFKRLIPPSSDELLHLKFHVSDPYCPSEYEMSSDRRLLGFALFHILAARPRSIVKSTLADLAAHLRAKCFDGLVRIIADIIQSGCSSARKFAFDSTSGTDSGLSIVVIDRAEAGALAGCLSGIRASVENMGEPVEIIAVSNICPEEAFNALPSRLSPRWIEVERNCTFAQALRLGISRAENKWVYVLDSRYSLDDSTLPELLKWRAARLFAVGSMLQGGSGWMGMRLKRGLAVPENRELDSKTYSRGALGVNPEASLYNRELLLQMLGKRDVYDSPEWANLEWGIRAWRMGFQAILCPTSQVHGGLGASPNRPIYAEADALRFLLRNSFPHAGDLRSVISKVLHGRLRACAGLLNPIALASHRVSRSMEQSFPFNESLLDSVNGTYCISPNNDRPALIFASPYSLFPPSHGSAVGMSYLLRALVPLFSVHILSDEGEAYGDESLPYFAPFATVHLLSGRREDPKKLHDRIARIESHSRPAMREALRMLTSVYNPRFVEIEHIELAKLIEAIGDFPAKSILDLHDVFLSDTTPGASAADRYELDLINRFDSLMCWSSEDASLLGRTDVTVVPNVVDLADIDYEPSPAVPRILFIGPSRSPQNVPGILDFLEHVYPHLLPHFDDLELWYLGGKGVHEFADREARFKQRGVKIFEYVDDARELLKQCAVTINPISGNRGSCRKVVESLAAGRVCVSTREGARGYLELSVPSLLTCETIQDFTAPMLMLLGNVDYRRRLERLDDAQRYKLSWEYLQEKLLSFYASLEAKIES
jgi:hypothetical protein